MRSPQLTPSRRPTTTASRRRYAAEAVAGRRFAAVLCHGVLGYLDDPDATADPSAETDTDIPEDKVTAELVASSVARMGKVIENQDGFVLYRFDGDKGKKSNCNGDCAKVWPPVLTNDGKPKIKGIDADLVGTIARADGSKQLTVKGNPVYTYVGDTKPKSWKGQNVSGKWFVIQPNGNKNLSCLPAVSKPVAPPADDSDSGSAGDEGSDYSY